MTAVLGSGPGSGPGRGPGGRLGSGPGGEPGGRPGGEPYAEPTLPPSDARGATTIPSSVVARIAQQAAAEVAQVGGAAGGVLGLGALGIGGRGDFDSRPSARCDLYGTVAVLSLDAGIAFPIPLESACRRLRQHVRERVESLTGLKVGRIDIEVSWLHPATRSRGELR